MYFVEKMSESQEIEGNRSFKNNPISQLSLVDKYVQVELIKNCSFEGFVHSVDPITNSIILSTSQGNFKTTVIPGHAILGVTTKPIPPDMYPPSKISASASLQDMSSRKTKIMEWFKTNFITSTEAGDRIVLGNVSILPPYGSMDICTDSPVVAMQIKKLLESMPEDINTG
ncbi:uncharacterized protein LOC115440728 [Manduca sexta]|uniref:uncharacterized protein LOC115440728 n=1 Tax=Manduca sexta TaxID=7130 RepID=UPI00188E2710|nr:uncharacterized protein LOC115440728 [Manduca sexta]